MIHPSRSRPEKSLQCKREWVERATYRHEWIISVDNNDLLLPSYKHIYQFDGASKVIVNPNRSVVDAVNEAAKIANEDVFIVVSDDFVPCQDWDQKLKSLLLGKSDFVVKTDDGIQKRIITIPIMDRTYYNRDGYIYNPIYTHSWSDSELTEVAHIRGRVIDARHIEFKHNHYSVTGEKPDELYLRNDATHDPGRKIFQERQRINFGFEDIN